jgi:hypothetical protein
VISPSINIKRTTLGVALVAAIGLSFFGGMAYQSGVDHPLIGQYAPSTTNTLARKSTGVGSTGSVNSGYTAQASGAAK